MCVYQGASIKGDLVIRLKNVVFQFLGAEGAGKKSKTNLINGSYRWTYMTNFVSLAIMVSEI